MLFHIFGRLFLIAIGALFIFRGYKDIKGDIYFEDPNVNMIFPTLSWFIISYKNIILSSESVSVFMVAVFLFPLFIMIIIAWDRNRRYFQINIYNIREEKIYDAIMYILDKNNIPYVRERDGLRLSSTDVAIKVYPGGSLEAPYVKFFRYYNMTNFKNLVMDMKKHIKDTVNDYKGIPKPWIGILHFVGGIATVFLAYLL